MSDEEGTRHKSKVRQAAKANMEEDEEAQIIAD